MKNLLNIWNTKNCFVLVVFAFALQGCSSYEGLITRADRFNGNRNTVKAHELYNKAITLKPHKSNAYFSQAKAFANSGNYLKAVNQLSVALILENNGARRKSFNNHMALYKHSYIRKIYSQSSFNQKQYKRSLVYLDDLSEIGQKSIFDRNELKDVKNYFNLKLAQNALKMNMLDDAVKYIDQVVTSPHNDEGLFVELYENIADLFIGKNQSATALYFLDRVKNLASFKSKDKIESIYKRFTDGALKNKDYETALIFVDNLIDFSEDPVYGDLKNKILNSYASHEIDIARSTKDLFSAKIHFEQAINLIKNTKKPWQISIDKLYIELAKIMFHKDDIVMGIEFIDRINTNNLTEKYRLEIKRLKVEGYLSLSKAKLKTKEYLVSLDYAYKILVINPEHSEAYKIISEIKKVKAEASFKIGSNLLHKKQFETAEYFIVDAAEYDYDFTPKVKLELAKLYELSFLWDKAIIALEEYNQLNGIQKFGFRTTHETNYEIARLSSLNGNVTNALDYLNKIYSSSNYNEFRELAFGNADFYNIKDEQFFKLWVNGKKRMSISIDRFTAIPDLDLGFGISDPRLIIQSPSFKLWSYIYKERNYVSFGDMYLIDDFNVDESVNIKILDYDGDEDFRGGDELFGNVSISPFSMDGGYYNDLYLDGNYHGTFHFSVSQTNFDPSFSNLFSDNKPRFIYPTYIDGKSCIQIVSEAGYELLKSELSFYPYLLANVVHWFIDNSVEATNDRVNEVAVKYIKKRYVPSDIRFGLKRVKQAGILVNAINNLSSSDCF